MFDQILVALDTDEDCSDLFAKALALAQVTGAKLHLIGVIPSEQDDPLPLLSYSSINGYPLMAETSAWERSQAQYQQQQAEKLNQLTDLRDRAIAAGVQTEFAQVTGNPGRAICDFAKAEKVDLVMVGSHQRRGVQELLMGSVSSYVMHRAPCSVMIVHASERR